MDIPGVLDIDREGEKGEEGVNEALDGLLGHIEESVLHQELDQA
jgi:hypothetical protein